MQVSLFITCFNDTLFPQTGQAAVAVLERLGHQVEFRPTQSCCGQMHSNSGYRPEALTLVRRFVETFRDAPTVVVPSTSCTSTIRSQYPRLAAEDGVLLREVEALIPRVFEFSEFLTGTLGLVDTGGYFPHRVTYHASCHGLRGLHLGDRPFRLLSKVRGLDFVPLEHLDRCCGFGGTFSVKNAEISQAMMTVKLHDVLSTKAEFCTALDNSCLMHLGGAMHRQYASMRTIHMAEILASTEDSPAEALA